MCRNKYYILTISLLFSFVVTTKLMSQPFCEVTTFNMRDGLAANTISGIAQTPNGRMWFSTWNGLSSYDGLRFESFRNQRGYGDMLSSNRLLMVRPNSQGDIWFTTYDQSPFLFDTHKCQFVDIMDIIRKKTARDVSIRDIYTLPSGYTWMTENEGPVCIRFKDDNISKPEILLLEDDNIIKKVKQDSKGREWLFTQKGLMRYGSKRTYQKNIEHFAEYKNTALFASTDGHLFVYSPNEDTMRPLTLPQAITSINDMIVVGDDIILATNNGLTVISMPSLKSRIISVQGPSQPSSEVTRIFADSHHRVWAFTRSQGVTLVTLSANPTVASLTSHADSPIHKTESKIPFFHQDANGTVWIAPTGGTFSYYCESESRLVPYTLKAGNGTFYSPSLIDKRYVDLQGNVWFTGQHDLHLANFGYHHVHFSPSMPNQEVRALLRDRSGQTWTGTYNGEVIIERPGQPRSFLTPSGTFSSTPVAFSTRIYALAEDKRGRMWIGTKGRGLYLYDNGNITHFMPDSKDEYAINNDNIYDIDIDNHNRIWVATYGGGVNLIDERQGKIRFINATNQLSNYPLKKFHSVRRITHTAKGEMILSTTGGLVTFSGQFVSPLKIKFFKSSHITGDTASLSTSDVMQTLVTSCGDIYTITLGGSLQKVASKSLLTDNIRFAATGVDSDEGLLQAMTEDSDAFLWVFRESSMLRYNPADGTVLRYGSNTIGDNMQLTETRPVYDCRDNKILVGAGGGYLCFNPRDIKTRDFTPQIIFSSVLFQGNSKRVPVLNIDVLDVPSDHRNLTIFFTAVDYTDKSLIRYAYKLQGVDEDWNYVGASNSVSFNQLPKGHHRLLVKSTNSDGIWVNNVAALDIYSHPTFWESWWAWVLYILMFCGALYMVFYIYNLKARAMLERELGEMKSRFFADISHKLRTPLTLIGGPVAEVLKNNTLTEQARQHLEMVERNAKRMLELVNQMLKYSKDHGTYISDDNASDNISDAPSPLTDTPMPASESSKFRILVVEDNADLRAFLVCILSDSYEVLQAANGKHGLEIAERDMPDFIITDVMMPEMNGLEMVHLIKQNTDICHIPIIVLSAKASLDDRLQGLKEGIDDYITKPFSATYLKLRVHNIINQRQAIQARYLEQLKPEDNKSYRLDTPEIRDADSDMMKSLLEYLEKHISDPNLRIEDLADAVNLGRTVFYGKIKSIVGMSPVDFLRHIRMQRAEELITKSQYPFSQIAYMVGFSDPKYFSKCFKKETGMTPSEYRNAKGL